MPGFGTGISAQVGFTQESVYGTLVTVDHFPEHIEGNLDLDPTWAEGAGLHAGGQYKRASRAAITTRQASGQLQLEFATKKMGLFVRNAMGSATATPTLVSGTTYKQVHQVGNPAGLSMSGQIGVPRVDGTVEPFTYPGIKIPGFKLAASEGGLLMMTCDLDAKDELTTATSPAGPALAAASYTLPNEVLNFTQAVFKYGGTASTASNVVSVASGVAIASLIRSFELNHSNGMATKRFGPSATKSEPLQNAYSNTVLTLDSEFAARTELYDVFRAGTPQPLQITFTGSALSTGFNTVDIVLAAVKQKSNKPAGNGQDLSNQPIELEVYDDGVNNPFQITITSADSTL